MDYNFFVSLGFLSRYSVNSLLAHHWRNLTVTFKNYLISSIHELFMHFYFTLICMQFLFWNSNHNFRFFSKITRFCFLKITLMLICCEIVKNGSFAENHSFKAFLSKCDEAKWLINMIMSKLYQTLYKLYTRW